MSFDPHIAGRSFLALARDVKDIGVGDFLVPADLASNALEAKKELRFSLGVFAPAGEQSRYESLGVDYIVSEDYGRLDGDE